MASLFFSALFGKKVVAMAQSIIRVSANDDYTRRDSTTGGKRLYGIFIGKLYNYLYRLQTYAFSELVNVPIKRFLQSVTETKCTPNAIDVSVNQEYKNETPKDARQKGRVIPQYLKTVNPDENSTIPLLTNVKNVVQHSDKEGVVTYVTVEYLDGTKATVSTIKGLPPPTANATTIGQNTLVGNEDSNAYIRFGTRENSSHVKNVRPYGADTVFRLRDTIYERNKRDFDKGDPGRQDDLGCFSNTRMAKMPRTTCPISIPFLPPISSKVHIRNMLRPDFVFEVHTREGTFMVKVDDQLVLRKFENFKLLSHGSDLSRPRFIEWNEPKTMGDDESQVETHEVINARGPLVHNLAESYEQRDNGCNTQKWKKSIRQRDAYLNGETVEYDEHYFTFTKNDLREDGPGVSVRNLFDQTTCLPVEANMKRGICRVVLSADDKLRAADPQPAEYDGVPYFLQIGTETVAFNECYCNLKFHPDPAVCAYARAHDSPYDACVPPLMEYSCIPSGLKWREAGDGTPRSGQELTNAQLSEALKTRTEFAQAEWDAFNVKGLRMDHFIKSDAAYFQPADDVALNNAARPRTLDGTRGASVPRKSSSDDDTTNTVFGLRHERDALQTLQRHLDYEDPYRFLVIANPNFTFVNNDGKRATPDGLVYAPPGGTRAKDQVMRARMGLVPLKHIVDRWTCVAFVESKSHIMKRPLHRIEDGYRMQVDNQSLVFASLGVRNVYFVSWSFKCTHVFKKLGSDDWTSPSVTRTIMASNESRTTSVTPLKDGAIVTDTLSARNAIAKDQGNGFFKLDFASLRELREQDVRAHVDTLVEKFKATASDTTAEKQALEILTNRVAIRVADRLLYVYDGDSAVVLRLFGDNMFVNMNVHAAIVRHMRLLGAFVINRAKSSTETDAWVMTVPHDPWSTNYNWLTWWIELQWLLALRPNAPSSTLISIDPAVMSTECAYSAVESTLMVCEMIKSASFQNVDHHLDVFHDVKRPTFEDVHIEERVRKELRGRTS